MQCMSLALLLEYILYYTVSGSMKYLQFESSSYIMSLLRDYILETGRLNLFDNLYINKKIQCYDFIFFKQEKVHK